MNYQKYKIPLLAAGGLLAGFINGLLGAGGGIIAVFLLGKIPATSDSLTPMDKKDALANALATMLPATAVSAFRYVRQGALPLNGTAVLIIPAVLGGVLGAILLDRIRAETARKIFSLIVIYSGIAMLLRG